MWIVRCVNHNVLRNQCRAEQSEVWYNMGILRRDTECIQLFVIFFLFNYVHGFCYEIHSFIHSFSACVWMSFVVLFPFSPMPQFPCSLHSVAFAFLLLLHHIIFHSFFASSLTNVQSFPCYYSNVVRAKRKRRREEGTRTNWRRERKKKIV